ncbi:MAG: hypothetical protein WC087_01530 [Candidatus Paceibacterota bacterium]
MKTITIDCDPTPIIPGGMIISAHDRGGIVDLCPEKIDRWRSDVQKTFHIKGAKLYDEVINKKPLNACVADFFMSNQELIPSEWENGFNFFWGTRFCLSRETDGDDYVVCIYKRDGRWIKGIRRIAYAFRDEDYAICEKF